MKKEHRVHRATDMLPIKCSDEEILGYLSWDDKQKDGSYKLSFQPEDDFIENFQESIQRAREYHTRLLERISGTANAKQRKKKNQTGIEDAGKAAIGYDRVSCYDSGRTIEPRTESIQDETNFLTSSQVKKREKRLRAEGKIL